MTEFAAMDVPDLHQRASREFGERVRMIGDDQWKHATPCSDWDVRELVRHLVDENLWTPPLMEGSTIAEVGDRFEGDMLGDDPKGAFDAAAARAIAAVHAEGAMDRTVHLSFGDFPGREYAMQLFADHLIHAWDLARALGIDERLDPELVATCAEWFEPMEEAYRGAGAIGPRPPVADDADDQTRLLAKFGRNAGA
ncbi:MAG: TIGR03086 family metal-binding protein [Actinomycetota bacterium]|nr:TIGR03086 family metal-binding protein [Actinomycetota bacterium]